MTRNHRGFFLTVLTALSSLFPFFNSDASPIKTDEEVIFFPTAGFKAADGQSWTIPVHGWIFEEKEDSLWRGVLMERLLKNFELEPEVAQQELFQKRAMMFLVDNPRGKKLDVAVGVPVGAGMPIAEHHVLPASK